jgi:hypothetical protein
MHHRNHVFIIYLFIYLPTYLPTHTYLTFIIHHVDILDFCCLWHQINKEKLFYWIKPIMMSIDEFNINWPYVNNIWCCQNVWTYSNCVVSNYLCCQYQRSEFLFRKTSQCLNNVLSELSSSVKWVSLPLTFSTKVQLHFNKTAIEQSILTPWKGWLLEEKLKTLWNCGSESK